MSKTPTTPAILTLKAKGVPFTLHAYAYEEKGGTRVSAVKLGVDEHQVIKTLVMEDDEKNALIILMHGDREVSTKMLARAMGVKWVSPCKPDVARKHTGYVVGGTSPFGTKKKLPIYMEASIADLSFLLINAGTRGLLVEMAPAILIDILQPVPVRVAI